MKHQIDPDHIDRIPFFFILGRPRSGTTLIQTLFDAHPNVIIPPESAVIKESYERFKNTGKWREKEITSFISFLYKVRKFKTWNLDTAALRKAISNYNYELKFSTLIRIVYSFYTSASEKEDILIFGDKNPRYSKYPEEMLKIMPESKFIHIVRDYRDHILSMQRTGLLNGHLPLIAYVWKASQQETIKFAEKHPGIVMTVKYEDFVTEPEKHLLEMCRFLDIPFEPSVLEFHENKKAIIQKDHLKSDKIFHDNLFKPVGSGNVDKWKKKMKKQDIIKADFIVGKLAEKSGYRRQFPKKKLSGFFRTLPGYGYIFTYYFLLFLIGKVPIKFRKKIKRNLSQFFPMGRSYLD